MARRGRPFKVHDDLLSLSTLIQNFENDRVKEILKIHGINAYDQNKRTAIINAVQHDNVPLLSWLLSSGADVNLQDKNGDAALHVAAHKGSVQMIDLLLKAGADINTQDCYGRNVLMSTVLVSEEVPDAHLITHLLVNGADPYKANNYGISAYHVMNVEQQTLTAHVLEKQQKASKVSSTMEKIS